MSLTKPLNSKVNMKQYSNADLPVNPKQPAVARYAAESTLNQTVINLPFQVDTVNAADSFILSVDGKVLTPGALNDYQFTAVDSFGFSSTITLNYSIAAGLNIQGIKLGLKKEIEFAQDARFTALYEGIDQGLQGFVRTADLMVATSTPGAPASGQFYSSISNRSAMVDQRSDLKVRMGIERIPVQQAIELPHESGPNGERVWGIVGDTQNCIRMVGSVVNFVSTSGLNVQGSTNGDYLEVTFYGTGLNLLTIFGGSSTDYRVSVDGGAEGTNVYPSSTSPILDSRGYSSNGVLNVASGLALGVHTVRVRKAVATGYGLNIQGVEIINSSSTLLVQAGASYLAGRKMTNLSQLSIAYNSGFESGTLGTRGGRVIVYQKADGSIAKAVQPANASSANMASADHSNEEVIRSYGFREFSAGRTDDYTSGPINTNNGIKSFTLEDGTVNIATTSMYPVNLPSGQPEGVGLNNNGDYMVFTFVGTGLDVYQQQAVSGLTSTDLVQIDGVTVASGVGSGIWKQGVTKIISGLPYGTHTFYYTKTVAGSGAAFTRFIVYGPKKPTLPAGANELADYNVVANFSPRASNGITTISTGVLRKHFTREAQFTGSWAISQNASAIGGWNPNTSTNGNSFSYAFFGTGVEILSFMTSGTGTATISIDGVAYTGAATVIGSGSYSAGTWTVGNSNAGGLIINSLALAHHTITVTITANASNVWNVNGIDIITPVHAQKFNSADLQNTLPVGSMSLSDSRKTSALKTVDVRKKAYAQAIGVTNNPSMTSTAFVPVPDLQCTLRLDQAGELKISYFVVANQNINQAMNFRIFLNGSWVGPEKNMSMPSYNGEVSDTFIIQVPAGVHNVVLYAQSFSGGTVTFDTNRRSLVVEER